MGQEITQTFFASQDYTEYARRLRLEAELLNWSAGCWITTIFRPQLIKPT
jgi:hypothetical protein